MFYLFFFLLLYFCNSELHTQILYNKNTFFLCLFSPILLSSWSLFLHLLSLLIFLLSFLFLFQSSYSLYLCIFSLFNLITCNNYSSSFVITWSKSRLLYISATIILVTCLLFTLFCWLLTTSSYSKLDCFRQFILSDPNIYCLTILLTNQICK